MQVGHADLDTLTSTFRTGDQRAQAGDAAEGDGNFTIGVGRIRCRTTAGAVPNGRAFIQGALDPVEVFHTNWAIEGVFTHTLDVAVGRRTEQFVVNGVRL